MAELRDWLSHGDAEEAPQDARPRSSVRERLRFYVHAQSTGVAAHIFEQLVFAVCSWLPGVPGVALRALAYRLILHMRGWAAIEPGVRICQAANLTLHDGAYIDHGVYLHACPAGIEIGANTYVMHRAELHVYNFRNLEQSGIWVGRNCIIGEYSVLRGQGGIVIGDNVIIAPHVQIMAVDHVFDDPTRPILEQGLRAFGITIEDDAWIGAGAIILDGVRIGRGAVVGAGAVVTRDVAPHTVVAGVPARLVRRIQRQRAATRQAASAREGVRPR
ncbi:MAG TPA: acyltransferase [Anaerolineae bacterium]|nr:acyltransferase [Anaerolineae bacterium]HOQ97313.1 acyltransferase [Anaerolineae bacterium]HOQ97356.1 acyltransferase [Anaerolineae bacterium]